MASKSVNKASAWKRVAVGVGIVGCLLAVGKTVPLPGLDSQLVLAVANCGSGSLGIMPIYDCFNWPTVLADPLSIGNAPVILPLVLATYLAFWVHRRMTGN